MLPFPPEVVRVDGECFTHLLYNLVRGEMHSEFLPGCRPLTSHLAHLPRLTYRYSRYSTDLLMFFASVSPRYLDETNLKCKDFILFLRAEFLTFSGIGKPRKTSRLRVE